VEHIAFLLPSKNPHHDMLLDPSKPWNKNEMDSPFVWNIVVGVKTEKIIRIIILMMKREPSVEL